MWTRCRCVLPVGGIAFIKTRTNICRRRRDTVSADELSVRSGRTRNNPMRSADRYSDLTQSPAVRLLSTAASSSSSSSSHNYLAELIVNDT